MKNSPRAMRPLAKFLDHLLLLSPNAAHSEFMTTIIYILVCKPILEQKLRTKRWVPRYWTLSCGCMTLP